jgi:uncharacterized protein (TIGR03000 family)
MYSVVLLMAMASGGDLPACHKGGCTGGGCTGSYGCSGGYGGCTGYSSCSGGYGGCCGGGGGHHFLGGGHHHSSGGCCGGGYAYSGCCGGGYYGAGCTGGYYGAGCTGGYYGGCSGGCWGGNVIIIGEGKKEEKKEEKKEDKKDKDESLKAAPATIIVSLPAEAKLTIDDAATTSISDRRVFTSPDLPMGREFHYNLKAEYTRDGKPVVISKQITVRAGEETTVTMESDAAGVASK